MQRTFVAIALALTLSCACATYINTQNYVKGPIQVVQNNETNYTNATALGLASLNAGEVDLLALNRTRPDGSNSSGYAWAGVYRKLDGKSLSGNANTSLSFTGGASAFYLNGYAISITNDSSNGVQQLAVYQKSISGGNALAPIFVTSNNDTNTTPKLLATGVIGKTVYVFYLVNNTLNASQVPTQINVTNFVAGGAKGSLEFNLTTTYNQSGPLSVTWGEALGSNQLYANWQEGTALKYSTIDVTKGTRNATAVGAWSDNYKCRAYSTDKKWFGDFCYSINSTNISAQTINYYVRTNTSSLAPLGNVSAQSSPANTLYATYPYGPYLAVFYTDSVTVEKNTTYSYELWNLDTLTLNKNKTTFLTTDLTNVQIFRVVSGGVYSLYQNVETNDNNGTITQYYSEIKAGLVLSGSYLTSVLGFIMTIVAGVLLF